MQYAEKKYVALFSLIFLPVLLMGQRLHISLFNEKTINGLVVFPSKGNYDLAGDESAVYSLGNDEVILITQINDSLSIKDLHKSWGTFRHVELRGRTGSDYFTIKPTIPELESSTYDNDLILEVVSGRILMLNHVDLDLYIAGVVETEGGPKAELEYYKSQAVITRTYGIENWDRHTSEGFNLCDGVHCQAYKNKCVKNFESYEGTLETTGQIITDASMNLITATFHSNCGGQTVNSEDLWVQPRSYLKSVNDRFCLTERNSNWEKEISIADWIKYLKMNGIDISSSDDSSSFQFIQIDRKIDYVYKNQRIPLKNIRDDWKLRSTFFSVIPSGDKVKLKGKGYGHGVGLCQEGAMKMAKLGMTYDKIIKFYYKDVYIVNLKSAAFIKE